MGIKTDFDLKRPEDQERLRNSVNALIDRIIAEDVTSLTWHVSEDIQSTDRMSVALEGPIEEYTKRLKELGESGPMREPLYRSRGLRIEIQAAWKPRNLNPFAGKESG